MNITGIRYPIVIGPGLNYRGVAAGISDMALAIMQRNTKLLVEMPSTPLDIIYIKDAADIVIKMIKTNSKLKNIYNCPSLRTSALKLANEFKNHNEKNNLEIKINGIGATYPIMNWQRLKKDINFKINYSVKQLVKDWL